MSHPFAPKPPSAAERKRLQLQDARAFLGPQLQALTYDALSALRAKWSPSIPDGLHRSELLDALIEAASQFTTERQLEERYALRPSAAPAAGADAQPETRSQPSEAARPPDDVLPRPSRAERLRQMTADFVRTCDEIDDGTDEQRIEAARKNLRAKLAAARELDGDVLADRAAQMVALEEAVAAAELLNEALS